MKKIFLVLLFISQVIVAQDKGTVKGLVTDKDSNNEPLPFANVFIKGTTIGGTTDFEGNYSIAVPAGNHVLVFSFVGYQTVEKNIVVKAGETLTVNETMSANAGVSLDEVEVKATVSREKESALLLEQRKAAVIKESIGAQRLSKIGVSNAATATTKISGVTKSEGTGDIYIRGLGDRYLSTTMNGLPIPSDDVENKNINLNLFSTDIIQSVGISKTYATSSYADQGSGNVDIATKEYTKKGFSIGISGGANTNVLNLKGDFRRTVISNDVTLGFHKKKFAVVNLITRQGWDTEKAAAPANFGLSFSGGRKFRLFEKDFSIFIAGSHSKSFNHRQGVFRTFRSNVLDNSFTDAELFRTNSTSTVYGNLKFRLNDNNKFKVSSLFVNKGVDNLYEQGRNGEGYVFDQDPQETGAFVRDQNFRQTLMLVNQLSGDHNFGENNKLKWAAGYNYVLAEEPNRIRNEVNILNANTVQYAHVGDFQQRKSSQKIEDKEMNAFVEDQIKFGKADEDGNKRYQLNFGANFRQKERTFRSLFIGVRAKDIQVNSIDNLSSTFTSSGFNNGLSLRERDPDRYNADLKIMAGYANLNFDFGKFTGNAGLRFERDQIDVIWDVANFVGRTGKLNKTYNGVFPSVNLKYELNEKSFLRLATSLTQTLPEFKELSPFEYVSPTGRVTKGNPSLEKSDIVNIDVKWEFFPTRKELISVTGFYKNIKNPINLALTRGSSGNFVYSNTGNSANAYGLEVEGRLNVINNEDDQNILNVSANLTQMWFNQDLLTNFQYKNKTTSGLQGASDFIANAALSYSNQKEKEFSSSLSFNYSSDKIFALGAPEDAANSATLYNDEIIEKGFVTLDLVLSKKLSDNLSLKLVGRNLTNPSIRQTQLVRNLNTGIETNETVLSYKKGIQLNFSIKYAF